MRKPVESKKQRSEASTELAKVWLSFVTTAVGVIAGLLSTLAAVSELFKLPNFVVGIVASIAAAALTAGFTAILARRERGTSRLAKLKDDLTAAYLSSLERSSLNPVNGDRR